MLDANSILKIDEFAGNEIDFVNSLNLISLKPTMYICNVDEESIHTGNELSKKVIEFAKKNNIDFIITDHHNPADTLPTAYSIINPRISTQIQIPGGMEWWGIFVSLRKYGVNNLEENTKVTQLEQGLATVFLVAQEEMILNGNGVIAKMVIGTMIPWTIMKLMKSS